jgi:hypothetical protein
MKNKIALAVVFGLFLAELSQAQIRFGARAAGSITNITDVHSNSKSRGGFQIGVTALIPITNNDILFFQPEVQYSAQGEFDQYFRNEGDYKQKVFVNMINVPLFAKLYFTDAESEFFAEAGPYFGIQIGNNTDSYDFSTEADDNEYSGFDFGAGVGIGYSLNRNVEFSVRYLFGLVDQVKNDAANASNKNSNLNFGISYFLP